MHDPVALAALASEIATRAGRLLADAVEGTREVSTKSSATDMVTEMDAAAESLIVEAITAARPDDAIIGEEGANRSGTSGVTWVVDPLDGTTNYLYRIPAWAVSIGVEVDGRPVAGAVDCPATNDHFVAAEGAGATRNGNTIALGDPAPIETALIGTGFNYDREVRARQGVAVAKLVPRVRDVRRMGAAAPDLCAVACGRLDAYVESGLGHWDHCAGTIIAREAGARVAFLGGGPAESAVVFAAHPDRWDELLALLTEVGLTDGSSF